MDVVAAMRIISKEILSFGGKNDERQTGFVEGNLWLLTAVIEKL